MWAALSLCPERSNLAGFGRFSTPWTARAGVFAGCSVVLCEPLQRLFISGQVFIFLDIFGLNLRLWEGATLKGGAGTRGNRQTLFLWGVVGQIFWKSTVKFLSVKFSIFGRSNFGISLGQIFSCQIFKFHRWGSNFYISYKSLYSSIISYLFLYYYI